MIASVEQAVIDRLQRGLGHMVHEVGSYRGEFDEDLRAVVRRFPAVWVTFGGIHASVPVSTVRDKWRASASFAVVVAMRNPQSEMAIRHGSARRAGAYDLIYAVRRLLTQQDLGLGIACLAPGKVKPLMNGAFGNEAIAAYSVEFTTSWVERALLPDRYPEPEQDTGGRPLNPRDPDNVFIKHDGELSTPLPELQQVGVEVREVPDGLSITSIVTFEEPTDE